ncbi:SURF1 family protein [Thalassococcus sp. S3]|uniref:SURF1 family protein n=1 Tax=Thalassococcus sp. S3 TaxID=2017482 RepID=UPI00102460DA|nr:SURF1 family protein [Thalassococcus sp. S3]QBF32936.1 cytochrome oxidase biogenesis protein Surf1, facilitates heme A insertion [Thalassococcus sp. S3]
MGRLAFLLIFGLSGAAILIGLGVWQVQRLAWKEGVLAEIDSRIAADPVGLPATFEPDADRYLPVAVTGEMLGQELHVLVSVKRVGAGYRVIAPFETETGRRVMVDRGFVPTDAKNTARMLGAMDVTGNLHWPREIDSYTPEPDVAGNTWFARDVPAMADALGTEPVLIVAKSQTDPSVTPLPVDTSGIPNDHLEYAITWFSLALIWVAMTAYFLWRSRARTES